MKTSAHLLLTLLAATVATTAYSQSAVGNIFINTWATAQSDMPQTTTLSGNSLRQVVQVSVGGSQLRLRLSDEMSTELVDIKAIYIPDAADSCFIDAKTATWLTFDSGRALTLQPGEARESDATGYPLRPLQRLSVTICYGEQTPQGATSHRGSRTRSYIVKGTVGPKATWKGIEQPVHWYNIASISVPSDARAVVVLGNSITDGRGSTTDAQNRWPDRMAEALEGEVAVLNLGIGGNCLVEGGLSEPAVVRFERDIMGQQGVTDLIIFIGTNDIGTCSSDYANKVEQMKQAYDRLISRAREAGMRVWMATITPTKGNGWYSYFHEAMRRTLNDWMRQRTDLAGIIDFDILVRDPADPERILPEMSDDGLHLTPAGYEAMGKYAAEVFRQ